MRGGDSDASVKKGGAAWERGATSQGKVVKSFKGRGVLAFVSWGEGGLILDVYGHAEPIGARDLSRLWLEECYGRSGEHHSDSFLDFEERKLMSSRW